MREGTYIVTLMTIMFLHMGAFGMSSALHAIQESFSEESAAKVQMIISVSTVFQLLISFFTVRIVRQFTERGAILLGLTVIVASCIGGFCFHNSIAILCLWMAIIGCGVGLVPAVSTTVAYRILSESSVNRLLGLRTCMVNAGGFILVFAGGLLTELGWHYNFLVYLLALIPLALCLLYLPGDGPKKEESAGKREEKSAAAYLYLPGRVYYYIFAAFLGNMLYSMFMMNISMLAGERGVDSSLMVGIISGAFMLGGMVYALLFSWFNRRIGEWMIPAAFADMLIGFMICTYMEGIPAMIVGGMIIGGSIPMIMPRATVSIAACMKGREMVPAMSLLLSFAPGLAGLFTPVIFTSWVQALLGPTALRRYVAATYASLVLVVVISLATARIVRRNGNT